MGPEARTYLFLQGPHGPFFSALGRMLRKSGADVLRVGFNAGDRAFWFDRRSYVAYRGRVEDWPDRLNQLIDERGVTDIVLYGDVRPVHAQAIRVAKARGLTVHVFEEGYLRPWWVTYERDGSNGNSRLMQLDIAQMAQALPHPDAESAPPPTHWGDMRQHVFYGALYHWFVMFWNRRYRNFRSHRAQTVGQEFRQYFLRLISMPLHRLERAWATARVRWGGHPYHIALLQLGHDSSVQTHSDFDGMEPFLEQVIAGFAQGAPRHHLLIIKEHPLENRGVVLRRKVRTLARDYAVADRVRYVPGGKLAAVLDGARSAVTINSTAGQQALWRGMPIKVFGRTVYGKPEFVSDQPIARFFAEPDRPDPRAYRLYRRFLLETSQIPGGYYSYRGRRLLLRQVADMMLAADDPYQAVLGGKAAPAPQLRAIK